MSDSKRIGIIVLVMTLLLVGMIAKKQFTLNTGELVVLKVRPVDPRSLFRGDYVRLNYDISQWGKAQYPILQQLKKHDVVFLTLKKKDVFWETIAISTAMPEKAEGTVTIRGKVNGRTIRFGIENYFMQEGEGLVLERLRDKGDIATQIAVDTFGNAGIKAVLLNGKPIYEERLF